MGLFDKLFRKKQPGKNTQDQRYIKTVRLEKGDTIIATGDKTFFKVIRPLTDDQRAAIRQSTIALRTGQLYMHYFTDNLVCTDPNDQEWQNKVMFFWKAEEPFPKKSLPPEFKNFKEKHFLFTGDTSNISLLGGKVIPWFGMPGLGDKHYCELDGEKITIPELNKLGLVEYVEQVELTSDNLEILTNSEYMFLIDERITAFENGNFYLDGKIVPIDVAYSVGGIHLVRKTGLE